jgi:ribosomal protein S27AE
MALFPCSWCGQRYQGKQASVYPAIVAGNAVIREKARECPKCTAALVEFLDAYANPAEVVPLSEDCSLCGDDSTEARFFVTLYPPKSDRLDYYGVVCAPCLDQKLVQALWGLGRPPQASEGAWQYLRSFMNGNSV